MVGTIADCIHKPVLAYETYRIMELSCAKAFCCFANTIKVRFLMVRHPWTTPNVKAVKPHETIFQPVHYRIGG